jgi:hypothetical protein
MNGIWISRFGNRVIQRRRLGVDRLPVEHAGVVHEHPCTQLYTSALLPAVKLIFRLPFKNLLICFGLSFSLFCMAICTRPFILLS